MVFQIRKLYPEDIPSLSHLYIEAYSNSTWKEKWNYENAYRRITELTSSKINIALICQIEKRIVGCVISEILPWHTGNQMEIKEIFVSPSYRNLGIGYSLIKKIEEIGKERNVSEYFLWTNSSKQLSEFYKHLGYTTNNDLIQFSKECKEDI